MRRFFYVWINKSKNCPGNSQRLVAGGFRGFIMQY